MEGRGKRGGWRGGERGRGSRGRRRKEDQRIGKGKKIYRREGGAR